MIPEIRFLILPKSEKSAANVKQIIRPISIQSPNLRIIDPTVMASIIANLAQESNQADAKNRLIRYYNGFQRAVVILAEGSADNRRDAANFFY